MKFKLLILAMFIFSLLFCGKCEDDSQSFIIHNNSDEEIIITYGYFKFIDSSGKKCIHTYKEFYWQRAVKPHSSKNMKSIAASIISLNRDTLYIEAFSRLDVDTMSCEEFDKKVPIKKEWALTQQDAEALDWTVTYP